MNLLTFDLFSYANRSRSESPKGFNHPLGSWCLAKWMTALTGEVGEAANIIKKMFRIQDGIPGNKPGESLGELQGALADELADAMAYLDLLAQAAGINLADAVQDKWNRVSAERGYPGRLGY